MRRLIPAALGAVALAALSLAPAGAASAGSAAPRTPTFPHAAAAGSAADVAAVTCPVPDLGNYNPANLPGFLTNLHCYTPNDIREHYGMDPLTSQSDEGAGQTIVLVDAYGSPTAVNDVDVFAQTFGGPTPDVDPVFPLGHPDYKHATGQGSGTSGPSSAAGWAGEANLDVQWAYAIAPKAHIVLLATPPAETQGVQGMPNLMKAIDWAVGNYPSGSVFSMSFGTSEEAFGGAASQQFAKFDQTFQRGISKGDSFFSSSGDDGSTGVGRAHHQSAEVNHESSSYPEVSPYVTSVGGTQAMIGWRWNPVSDTPFTAAGHYNPAYFQSTASADSEAVWNESWLPAATGGGVSSVYPRPTWQSAVLPASGNHRLTPDLSWNAAVNGGALVYSSYFPELFGPASWGPTGGTSAASPQVAALTAVGNAARAGAHKAPLGNVNPVIYGSGFNRAAAFTDVDAQTYGTAASGVLADNRMWDYIADGSPVVPDAVPGYPTTPGYDLTTGWGTPNAPGYIAALTAAP